MGKNMKGYIYVCSLTGGSDSKESACNVRDWVQSLGWEDPQKAWQPAPGFLPGESPWTEEPGRLQSMGSQRVSHD